MKNRLLVSIVAMAFLVVCDPDTTGPETDCNISQNYKLEYYPVDTAKVIDIRTGPPKEIMTGVLNMT